MLTCTLFPCFRSWSRSLLLLAVAGGWLGTAARAEPSDQDNRFARSSPKVLAAFRKVVAGPSQGTVRIKCDDKEVALGTVVGADGWVLTKASQLDDNPVCILKDGRELEAKVVGTNERYDLALLKIDAKGLKPVKWANSQAAPVGNWVASPGLGRDPVAIGVVSVATRVLPRNQLRDESMEQTNGFLGVGVEAAEDEEGVRIYHIVRGSAAARAGLRVNDIILTLAGQTVTSEEALVSALKKYKPGQIIRLKVKRGEKEMRKRVTLGERPQDRSGFQNSLGSKLSRRGKGFPTILQHDTVLEPTDCGGPLVDLDGRAIGINISRAGRTESYAIPAEALPSLLKQLSGGKLAVTVAKE
jgi:serine protease Do